MKTIRIATIATLATLTLAACTNEDQPTPADGTVQITATIAGATTRAPQLGTDGSGTFDDDDIWGLYTFTGSATSPTYSKENIQYYADHRTTLRWDNLSTTEPVTFAAHYPRQTTVTDPKVYNFTPQGTTFADDDLLLATDTKSNGGTVILTFRHLMHRLIINLQKGTGMESADLSGALIQTIDQISAASMRATIPVNLLTGELGVPMYDVNYSSTGPDYDMIVVPQDLTPGADWLKITVGTDIWRFPVPADLDTTQPGNQTALESGKSLTLNLTLKKTAGGNNEVDMADATISQWGDQGTINNNVNAQ